MRILLVDNNDSFTRNLEHLLVAALGAQVDVVRYADAGRTDVAGYDLLVISPGPGTPSDYPGYEWLLEADKPVLGVCLGMQIMNEFYGGATGRLAGCVHGRTDVIDWQGEQHTVARYHSLHAVRVGDGLEVLGRNSDGVVMGVGSKQRRHLGFQFHPESFLTPDGGRFIRDGAAYLGL